jgi:hypothetical protein
MQPEKSCDHDDHDHYADDVKNIHCFAPVEATLGDVALPSPLAPERNALGHQKPRLRPQYPPPPPNSSTNTTIIRINSMGSLH